MNSKSKSTGNIIFDDKFDGIEEQVKAAIEVLRELHQGVSFRYVKTDSPNTFAICFEMKEPGTKMDVSVHASIITTIDTIKLAFTKLDAIMEGDDYNYSTQRNFD